MPIYGLDILDEGQSFGFWSKFKVRGYYTDKTIRVTSVSDMVTKVLEETEGQKQKITIYLNGVGQLNYQSVGAGATQDPAGNKSLQVNDKGELNQAAKTWLPRLNGRVLTIRLMGIEESKWTAENKGNFPLMNAIATLLTGVHVQGQFGGSQHIYYLPSEPTRPPVMRSQEERQKLRDSLKKLDEIPIRK